MSDQRNIACVETGTSMQKEDGNLQYFIDWKAEFD
jgi:hypothetical protein